jgi:hypothetical protein
MNLLSHGRSGGDEEGEENSRLYKTWSCLISIFLLHNIYGVRLGENLILKVFALKCLLSSSEFFTTFSLACKSLIKRRKDNFFN